MQGFVFSARRCYTYQTVSWPFNLSVITSLSVYILTRLSSICPTLNLEDWTPSNDHLTYWRMLYHWATTWHLRRTIFGNLVALARIEFRPSNFSLHLLDRQACEPPMSNSLLYQDTGSPVSLSNLRIFTLLFHLTGKVGKDNKATAHFCYLYSNESSQYLSE